MLYRQHLNVNSYCILKMDANKKLEEYVSSANAESLVESLFYRDTAIRTIIADEKHKMYEPLKTSLIEIVEGKNPAITSAKQSAKASMNALSDEAQARAGFLPMAFIESAGMKQQIEAIEFLAPMSQHDDAVYKLLWKTAGGETSMMANVHWAALNQLAWRALPARKQDMRIVALNPEKEQKDRVLAYTILAYKGLFNEPETYEFVCDIASDQSITKLYEEHKILSPSAKFWYEHEIKIRKEFEHRRDGKSDEEIKTEVVDQVQKEFQEKIFDVIEYFLDNSHDLWNNLQQMNHLQKGFPQTSQRLTKELCRLIARNPSYRVRVVEKYFTKLMRLSRPEAQHIVETLKSVRPYFAGFNEQSEMDGIDKTVNKVMYGLNKQRISGFPHDYYMDDHWLEEIWHGRLDLKEIRKE